MYAIKVCLSLCLCLIRLSRRWRNTILDDIFCHTSLFALTILSPHPSQNATKETFWLLQLKWQITCTLNVSPVMLHFWMEICVASVLVCHQEGASLSMTPALLGHTRRGGVRAFGSYLSLSSKPGLLASLLLDWLTAGISQTMHSVLFGDNFSLIKADIMTVPPTHSAVIMKVMFPENDILCS